jgi:hypothetical protein
MMGSSVPTRDVLSFSVGTANVIFNSNHSVFKRYLRRLFIAFTWVLFFQLFFQLNSSAQTLHLRLDERVQDFDSLTSEMQKLGFQSYILSAREFTEMDLPTSQEFSILIDYKVNYLSSYKLSILEDSLLNQYAAGMMRSKNDPLVAGHIVLRHPALTDTSFREKWNRIQTIIAQFNPSTFYIQVSNRTNELVLNSDDSSETFGVLVSESNIFRSPFQQVDILRLHEAMNNTTDSSQIFIDQSWLEEALFDYPTLEESLLFWNETGRFILPLPTNNLAEESNNGLRLSIIFVLGVFIMLYGQSRMYQNTTLRYFTNYGFFADDVLRYSDRYTATASTLFFLRAFIVSLTLVIWFLHHWSETDWEFFRAEVTPFGKQLPAAPALTMVLFLGGLLVQSIELLLLKIPKSGFQYTRQIFSLYSWNVHLNLLVLIAVFILFVNQSSLLNSPLTLSVIALAWVLGYFITALQGIKSPLRGNKQYLFWSFTLALSFWTTIVVLSQSIESIEGFQSIFYHL